MSNTMFTFMGTAAGCGVPSFFCDCPACNEARENPRLARGDCGCMVRNYQVDNPNSTNSNNRPYTVAIDTPPDARHQLIREHISDVDAILFTHCHFDHIGGLGEYEYMVQLKHHGKKLPVYGSKDTLEGIAAEFHYMQYCLEFHEINPFDSLTIAGVKYTALPVKHAPGTYGYLLETPDTRLFYASDTSTLPPETASRLKDIDILAMDATFWGNNWSPDNHHSIQECIREGLELNATTTYLTHVCMHYDTPITYKELTEYLEQFDGRIKVALDGLSFNI